MKFTFGFLALVLLAIPAMADVSVGCAGASGNFDFRSISAAVNAAPDGSTINVSGTCSETVFIGDRRNLTLGSVTGAVLQPDPNALGQETMDIFTSTNVTIKGLTIRGIQSPFALHISDSVVSIIDSTITGDGSGAGILSQGHSNIQMRATTVQNNLVGIRLDAGSVLNIGETIPNDPVPSVVRQNPGFGIWARHGATAIVLGSTILQNNGIGLDVDGGSGGFCCDEPDQRQVIDNQIGIRVSHGSLEMRGPVLVEGNSLFAVRMIGAAATFFGGQTIEGNGAANDKSAGSISLEGNSQLDLFGTEIKNNSGVGLTLADNSSARVSGDTISGNPGGGMGVSNLSTMTLFGDSTVAANGSADLTCSPDSLVHGDPTGVGKMFCPHFNVEPLPGPQGPKPPKL